jgi:hypothetical protein
MGDLSDTNFLPKKEATPDDCSMTIKEICQIVRSGDIILFSGASWTSWFVTMFCASRYSHIGIVYRAPGQPPQLFESIKSDDDGSPNCDVRTGKHRVGVRLVDLKLLLKSFRGYAIAVRTLTTPATMAISEHMDEHMTKSIARSIERYGYLPYEHRWFNFVVARYNFMRLNVDEPDALFCSELVARCFQEAGLLSPERSSVQYLPDDFSQMGAIHLSYPLSPSVAVGVDTLNVVQLSRELLVVLADEPRKKFKEV